MVGLALLCYLGPLFSMASSASGIDCSDEGRRWERWEVGPDRYYRSFGGLTPQLWSEANRHGIGKRSLRMI